MKIASRVLVLAAVLALPTTVLAQTEASANHRALAAGYKALTVCSAVHSARAAGAERTVASVEANELIGIYPELQPLVGAMKVEMAGNTVAVPWDQAARPRVATWTEGRGCVIEPMGYAPGAAPERAPLARRASAPDLPTARPKGNARALEAAVGRASIRVSAREPTPPAWW